MWYAVQVISGEEEKVKLFSEKLLKEEIEFDCLIPKYETMMKYAGRWHKKTKPLFPGYVFFITEQAVKLFFAFKKIPKLTKMMLEDREVIDIHPKEVKLLKHFLVLDEDTVPMSTGYIEGDKVIVTDGPMAGYEGHITYVNRHKRIATLAVEMFGRKTEITLGLELVEKFCEGEGPKRR